MTKRKQIAIVISILVFAGAIAGMLYVNRSPDVSHVRAVGGVLELQMGEAGETAPILLDGEWELYPGVLIEPGERDGDLRESDGDTGESQRSGQAGRMGAFAAHRDIRTLIQVPGPWDEALPDGGPSGSGTYRLRITVPEEGTYGIKTGTIRTSARIYANGNLLTSIGTPSTDYATYELGSRP
ncbi:MAG: hypothetical protein WCY55_06865 [Anaerovoracaceae bacterium]|jgi:two-component system sensor histidine kinase ChiS